jgi:hypothetical protein
MREDILETLEKEFPNGFAFFYIDGDERVRISGNALDGHPFLTSIYHFGLALASIWDGFRDE